MATDEIHGSDEFYRLWDVSLAELVRFDQFAGRLHPDDIERVKTDINNAILLNESFNTDHRVRVSDGTWRFINTRGKCIKDEDRKSNIIVGTCIDITERKIYENEISNAKADAERANTAKSEFLSRMSHELRTPMNSILGFAQLMEMGELSATQKEDVTHILKSGKLLLGLINEVLELSKIEAGKLSISLEPVQLKIIIRETIDVIRPIATLHSVTIEQIDLDYCELFVKADHQKLKQVLLNLLSNAVKYNRKGGTVKVFCEKGSVRADQIQTIRIIVNDTGIGIAQEEIPKLFTPFQRIGSLMPEVEGTGLGLAVTIKLVEAMNGTVGVESKVGEGSTFWIELPQCEGQVDRQERLTDSTKHNIEKSGLSGTLLYIEDNQSNIELVKKILAEHRPEMLLISGTYGKNALQLALDHKPGLVLLDLNLPDMHGSEVLGLLKSNIKTMEIPVVVLSADAMSGQIKKC